MPFKSRLIQAIRDEEARLRTDQALHVAGPGAIVAIFIAVAGWFAVRVLHAPELFGGGAFEIACYGFLGAAIVSSLTKRYSLERWLDGWVQLRKAHLERVARIEAVMAKLEQDELERAAESAAAAGEAPAADDDPWMRALTQQKEAAAKES